MIRFESEIERMVYPIINTLAIQHKLKFTYQKKLGYQSGGLTKEDWCMANNKYYDHDESSWENYSWECELYRVDFVLESEKIKLAIEIDGEDFHKNKEKDEKKDSYLMRNGFKVLRFTGKDVFKSPYRIKEQILKEIK